ncbi:hypothetical protein N7530_007288 [Penicillium desertorum]|uniref:Uncharacterized protein n=1 Tax=Penicillium desertorum TaxID=1303715 RepID=A0A9W9WM18_9EURO|nr:hypothetical protein N7530_007288 [Penicillium desertorum]
MARVGLTRVTCAKPDSFRVSDSTPAIFLYPGYPAHFPTVCPISRRIMKLARNGHKFRRPAAIGTGAHDVEDYLHAFD